MYVHANEYGFQQRHHALWRDLPNNNRFDCNYTLRGAAANDAALGCGMQRVRAATVDKQPQTPQSHIELPPPTHSH